MDPNIRYVKNGTVYFDGPFRKAWPRRTHPVLPEGKPVTAYLADCFKMIYDQQADADIVKKLNELKGVDVELIWNYIYGSNILETFELTQKFCHLLSESHHKHLVPAVWDKWTSHALMPYLEKMSASPNWSKGEYSWNRAYPLLDLVSWMLADGQEIHLCNAYKILQTIPGRLKQEFSESHHKKIQERLDSYTFIYNYLWLDLKGVEAFDVIKENGQMDAYVFRKMIDLASQSEEGFKLLDSARMVSFLENLDQEDDQEIVGYFLENPEFLYTCKKINFTASFQACFFSAVVGLPKATIGEGLNTYKRVFAHNLDEQFYDLYLTQQLEMLTANSVTGVLGSVCSLGPCPEKADLLVQVCQKISDLIVKNKTKLDPIVGRWLKLTQHAKPGQVFELDRLILTSFEKKIPKSVSANQVIIFTTRLASDASLCVKSISLIGQVILGNKNEPIPQETITTITRLNPKLKYNNLNRLLKALSILCKAVSAQEDKKCLFEVILFLLADKKAAELSGLNDDFWQSCYVSGRDLKLWNSDYWRTLSDEMYKHILIKEFLVAKGSLNGQHDGEEVYEIINEQVKLALENPKVLKDRVIALIQNHLQKIIKGKDKYEIEDAVSLLLTESISILFAEKKDLAKIKKELVELVGACVEHEFDLALRFTEACVFESEIPLWEVIFRHCVGMTETNLEPTSFDFANIQMVFHRFDLYVKDFSCDVSPVRDMYFSLGLFCCKEPTVVTEDHLKRLRDTLQYYKDKDNPEELLKKLVQYLENVATCISETPEDESEVLYRFYEYLMITIGLQKRKDNPLPNLQISLLRMLNKIDPGSTQTLRVWLEVIQNRSKHTKKADLQRIAKSFFKYNNAKVVTLFESLARTKYFNCTNLIILLQAWCAEGDYALFLRFISVLQSFIKFSNNHAIDLPSEDFDIFVRDYLIPLQTEICDVKRNLVEILNMLACIVKQPTLSKSLSKETHLKLLKAHRKGALEVIRRDTIENKLTMKAVDDAFFTLMILPVGFDQLNGSSMTLNAGKEEVYKRNLFVKEFLRADLNPDLANLTAVLQIGIETYAFFLSLFDLSKKVPYKYTSQVEEATFKYIDWNALRLSNIHIPFEGRQKSEFAYRFIKSLMRLDLEGQPMSLVMVFYIWELLKGFKKSYPKMKAEYEELCLDFVYFPNYMTPINQHAHWILCYASNRTGMFANFSAKNRFLIDALLDPQSTVTAESKVQCESFQLGDFIRQQGKECPSLFIFDVWDCFNQKIMGGEAGATTVGWCRAFYNFVVRIKLNTEIVRYIHRRGAARLLNLFHTLLLPGDVFNTTQKTKIAGFLAVYHELSSIDAIEVSDKAKFSLLRDYYLRLPLENNWVKVDDPIYVEILAKLN